MTSKNDKKKEEELACLKKFIMTPIGADWYNHNAVVDIRDSEHPDFLAQTKNGKIIGLEVANIIAENENTRFTQVLMRIGEHIYEYVKKKYNIDVSIIIDKFNKDMWCRKDFRLISYKMGFSDLPSPKGIKELQKKMEAFFDAHIDELKKWPPLIQAWIEIEGDYFKISADPSCEPFAKSGCHVNNALRGITDPVDVIQKTISNKNKKLELYLKQSEKCFLLLFASYFRNGSVCSFTPKILKHKFESNFTEIFLFDEQHNEAYRLRTKNPIIR